MTDLRSKEAQSELLYQQTQIIITALRSMAESSWAQDLTGPEALWRAAEGFQRAQEQST